MFENPSARDQELVALEIHEKAYEQSLAIIRGLPQSTERAKTITQEEQSLAEVRARKEELQLVASTPKPAVTA